MPQRFCPSTTFAASSFFLAFAIFTCASRRQCCSMQCLMKKHSTIQHVKAPLSSTRRQWWCSRQYRKVAKPQYQKRPQTLALRSKVDALEWCLIKWTTLCNENSFSDARAFAVLFLLFFFIDFLFIIRVGQLQDYMYKGSLE